VEYNEMVIVKDINFYSLCEHHLLPFFGKATVAYIPKKKIVGLSKIPKIVNVFARRLQVQERMTRQIAETLVCRLKPLGVGVILEARHLCMEMRGAQSQDSPTITSTMLGCFQKDSRTRQEFLKLTRG
ncbi:MAG: GTP cyclohydrolase I FolE, partial [Elusimicrobiota bacterium]